MIKKRLASQFLADRGARLAGVPLPESWLAPSPGQDAAAPDAITPASGAVTGVDLSSAPDIVAYAIHLPDHAMVLVRGIAAYERCSNERACLLALADYATKIGAGPLVRAVFELSEGGP